MARETKQDKAQQDKHRLWLGLEQAAMQKPPYRYNLDEPIDRRRSGWIVSFTDLMAIMLAFFVLIFSMSAPTVEEWQIVARSFDAQYQKLADQLSGHEGPSEAANITRDAGAAGHDLDYIQALLEGRLQTLPDMYQGRVFIARAPDRLTIYAPDIIRFERGSTDLPPQAADILGRLATILKGFDNRIMIVGQASLLEMTEPPKAENAPAQEAAQRYPHILSFNRALTVARLMQGGGYDKTPIVAGLGSDRKANLPDAFSDGQKDIFLRRADIVILKERES